MFKKYYQAPFGWLKLIATDKGLSEIDWASAKADDESESAILTVVASQLDEYFAGKRQTFDVPLDITRGTDFQRQVWTALRTIPYGETVSYKDIATKIGNPKAVRAVGGANNKNPIAIIVPCHRVIGMNGTMVGYAGGVDKKIWLLEHERKVKSGE